MNRYRKEYRRQRFFMWLAAALIFIGCTSWYLDADAAEVSLPRDMRWVVSDQLTTRKSPNKDYLLLIVELPAAQSPMFYFNEVQWGKQAKDIAQFNEALASFTPLQQFQTAFCQLNMKRLTLACKDPAAELQTLKHEGVWYVPFAVVKAEEYVAVQAALLQHEEQPKQKPWVYKPQNLWKR